MSALVPSRSGIKAVFLREAAVYGLGRGIAQLSSLLLLPIYLVWLSPEQYGQLALAQMFQPVFVALMTLGLDTALIRYFHTAPDAESQRRLIGSLYQLTWLAALGGLLLLGISFPWIGAVLPPSLPRQPHLLLVVGSAFAASFANVPLGLMRMRHQPTLYVAASLGTFLVTAIATLYLVVSRGMGVVGVLWGGLVGQIIAMVGYLFYMRGYLWARYEPALARRSLRYVLPMLPEAILNNLLLATDRMIMDRYLPLATIGFFALARQIGNFGQVVVGTIKIAFTPSMMKAAACPEPARRRQLRTVSATFLAMAVLTTLLLILFPSELLLFPRFTRYAPAIPYVRWLALGGLLTAHYFIFLTTIQLNEQTRRMTPIFFISGAFLVTGNFWLIPRFGIMGAVISMLFYHTLRATLTYWRGEAVRPVGLPLKLYLLLNLPILGALFFSLYCEGWLAAAPRIAIKVALLAAYAWLALRALGHAEHHESAATAKHS